MRKQSNKNKKASIVEFCHIVKKKMKVDIVHIRTIDWIKGCLTLEGISPEEIATKYQKYVSVPYTLAIGGTVFKKKKPKSVRNVQRNQEFRSYLKTLDDGTPYKDFLKTFKSVIVVPILLYEKPIGVLAAIRLIDGVFKDNFDESNVKRMVEFAATSPSELQTDWLWEVLNWEPKKDDYDSIVKLSNIVRAEAIKKTGAKDVQMRLLNYEDKLLIPSSPQEHPLVMLTVCQLCTRCGPESCPESIVKVPDGDKYHLENKFAKSNYIRFANKKKEFFIELLNKLKKCEKKVSNADDNEMDVKKLMNNFSNHYTRLAHLNLDDNENITKQRFKIPTKLNKTEKHIKKFFSRQIEALTDLSREWGRHVDSISEYKSVLVVLIQHGQRILGVISAYSDETNRFLDIDKSILHAMATRVAIIIVEHQQELVKNLLRIGLEIASSRNYLKFRDQLLHNEIKTASAYFQEQEEGKDIYFLPYRCTEPSTPATLLSYSQENALDDYFKYIPREGSSDTEVSLANTPIRSNGLGYRAIEKLKASKRSPIFEVCGNVVDPITGGSEEAYDLGIKSTACIPLASERTVYGLLYIHSKQIRFFTKIERDAIILLAQQATTLLKIHFFDSNVPYGHDLVSQALKKIENQPVYFSTPCDILEGAKLAGNTQTEATDNIKNIVKELVRHVGLPSAVGNKYEAFQAKEEFLSNNTMYRDHFFHTFHVYLLGFEILKQLYSHSDDSNNHPLFGNVEKCLKKWTLVSMSHDLLYTVEQGGSSLERQHEKGHNLKVEIKTYYDELMRGTAFISSKSKILDKIEQEVESQRTNFESWIISRGGKGDHGILSAHTLLQDYERVSNTEITPEEIVECATSIALHNYPKWFSHDSSASALNIEDFPLAYLLSYCDTIQEWGRPSKNSPEDYITFESVEMESEENSVTTYLKANYNKYVLKDTKKERTTLNKIAEIENVWNGNIDLIRSCWKPPTSSKCTFILKIYIYAPHCIKSNIIRLPCHLEEKNIPDD